MMCYSHAHHIAKWFQLVFRKKVNSGTKEIYIAYLLVVQSPANKIFLA